MRSRRCEGRGLAPPRVGADGESGARAEQKFSPGAKLYESNLGFLPTGGFGGLNPLQTPTLGRYRVDATTNEVGFLEPFLALS